MDEMKKQRGRRPSDCQKADAEMEQVLEEMAHQVGATKTELKRRAIKNYIESGMNEPAYMVNLVQILMTLSDNKDKIPEDVYDKLQGYTGNILKLKGGKGYGNI